MKIPKKTKVLLADLIEAAKKNEILTYKELAEKRGHPGSARPLYKMLMVASQYTYAELGVFISALVVNDKTGVPGIGFLQLVESEINLEKGSLDDSFTQKHIKTLFALDHNSLDQLMLVGTR